MITRLAQMSLTDLLSFPGMTRYENSSSKENKIILSPLVSKPIIQRPIVLLATALITDDNIFMNGLFQNVYVLYRLFEAIGTTPIMFVNKKPDSLDKIPSYMRNIRIMASDDIAKSPIPIKLYIEIGMSVDINMHKFLKMCGAKICKLYLGNILNIDIENPIFMPGMNFAHHVKGMMDEIWVSPHYSQHGQYARALNKVDLEKKEVNVVPYVWDSQMLTGDNERKFQWRPPSKVEDDVFLILEPNISFQKCSLIPLLILEAWFRKNPNWKGEVVLINGERLLLIPFFRETIWKNLELVKAGRVKTRGRVDILTLLKEYPSAIPVCHQWNNEYNYMVLEYFHCGFPVLHNASDWSDYGYYYPNADFAKGVEQIEKVREFHHENLETYKSHARALGWKHSHHNPDVQEAWRKVVSLDN
jgi:hypothetical protein